MSAPYDDPDHPRGGSVNLHVLSGSSSSSPRSSLSDDDEDPTDGSPDLGLSRSEPDGGITEEEVQNLLAQAKAWRKRAVLAFVLSIALLAALLFYSHPAGLQL